jgi:hypothetical protein
MNSSLRDIWGIDQSILVLTGDGHILETEDEGRTWTDRQIGLDSADRGEWGGLWGTGRDDFYATGACTTCLVHWKDNAWILPQRRFATRGRVRGTSATDIYATGNLGVALILITRPAPPDEAVAA